ncbi:hypothetical protein WR25_03307 [Diploscapter pachys]|uniref:Uncharacterized protein n=1 Tax=Diploscapter pachys TaxID=2018661 RepID=A0A2A2L372_9BILA|nr:hypothetical protein WR25_03307 [Diploscapter pachys]
MMTTESRAAQCCCCNARLTLIALLCFYIFLGAICSIFGILRNTFLLFVGVSLMALYIFLLYGAMKRQPCILIIGYGLSLAGAISIGVLCLLFAILGSVFAASFSKSDNADTSSRMRSMWRSTIFSQQELEAMSAMLTGPLIAGITIFMIVMVVIQVMICYLHVVVYREAKRFQGNQVMVQAVGIVMQQGNYPNYPSYSTPNYPTPTPTYPTNYPPYGAKTATMAREAK